MDSTVPLVEGALAPVLKIEEAARVLRVGRSLAYELAHEYLATGGTAGIPVIRIGSCLRVPSWALLELAHTGRVVRLCDAPSPAGDVGGDGRG
jgi:hypothetical protein